MGVKVGTLAKQVEHAQMKVGDGPEDVVNIEFRPGALTFGALSDLAAAAAADSFDPEMFANLLKPIIVSWDLLDDDGNALPTDRSGLNQLPMEFVSELLVVLTGNAKVDPEEGKASDGTLQQTANSAESLSGT
jgi:hypothetical protein